MHSHTVQPHRRSTPAVLLLLLASTLPLALTGCIGVGYSSGSGFFIWPPIGLILLVLLILFVIRRR